MSSAARPSRRGGQSPAAPDGSQYLVGLLTVCISQAIFGSMGMFYKLALAEGASTLTILALRFPLAALALWGIVLVARRRLRVPRARLLALFGMGAGCYVGQSYFFLAALNYIQLSTAVFILLIYPAIVMVAAIALGRERATGTRVAALLLSLAGCGLLVGGPGGGAMNPLGLLLAVVSTVIYAVYILVGDRVLRGSDGLVASGYILSSAAVGFVLLALLLRDFTLVLTPLAWGSIFAVAWFCTVFGATGLLIGLPRVGPSVAAIAGVLEPLTAVVLGVLVLGERVTPTAAVGGLIILAAVVLLRKPVATRAGAAQVPAPDTA